MISGPRHFVGSIVEDYLRVSTGPSDIPYFLSPRSVSQRPMRGIVGDAGRRAWVIGFLGSTPDLAHRRGFPGHLFARSWRT